MLKYRKEQITHPQRDTINNIGHAVSKTSRDAPVKINLKHNHDDLSGNLK